MHSEHANNYSDGNMCDQVLNSDNEFNNLRAADCKKY